MYRIKVTTTTTAADFAIENPFAIAIARGVKEMLDNEKYNEPSIGPFLNENSIWAPTAHDLARQSQTDFTRRSPQPPIGTPARVGNNTAATDAVLSTSPSAEEMERSELLLFLLKQDVTKDFEEIERTIISPNIECEGCL